MSYYFSRKSPALWIRWLIFISLAAVFSFLFVYLYSPLLLPLGVGLFIAYLILPYVELFESKYRIKRSISSVMFLFFMFLILSLVLLVLLPVIVRESLALKATLTYGLKIIANDWFPKVNHFLNTTQLLPPTLIPKLMKSFDVAAYLSESASGIFSFILSSAPGFVFSTFSLILVPLVCYFTTTKLPSIRLFFKSNVPQDFHGIFLELLRRLDASFRSVIVGQLFVAITNGICYIVALSILGFDYAFAIGFSAGLARLIPYGDAIVCGFFGGVIFLSHQLEFYKGIWLLGIIGIVQTLDAMIITPKIMGDRVGLHPIVLIVSIIVLGSRFGFLGVLMSLPFLAVMKVLFEFGLEKYRTTRYFLG